MGGPERSSSSYQSSRHRTRSKSRERYRDRDRERDYHSSSSSRRHKSKSISKHSRKSKYHRRSSSSSNSSDDSSNSSRDNRIRAPSSESNSRSAPTTSSNTSAVTKGLDLMDFKVQKTLNAIEEDSFKQKTFFSTKDREAPEKSDKVIIDLNAETVTFPKPLELPSESVKEEIFHPNFLGDQEQKQDKWIRKLLMYRQKYMSE